MESRHCVREREPSTGDKSMVAFRLAQQVYALPVESIEQIIPMVTITPIPSINGAVRGVICIRGAAVPVIDLRTHFGLPEANLQMHTPILLIRACERVIGLIVDEITDVLVLASHEVADIGTVLPEELGPAPILKGLTRTGSGLVMLLNPDCLLTRSEATALSQAIQVTSSRTASEAVKQLPGRM